MRRLRHPGAVMGIFALGLEATGVASGAYVYGDFPIKILGVPLCIPMMWVLVMALAYMVSKRYGPAIGVLAVCCVDLILEPVAYYTGIWTWLAPYTPQIYFGSTIANALVWAGMALIGIRLWEHKRRVNARGRYLGGMPAYFASLLRKIILQKRINIYPSIFAKT